MTNKLHVALLLTQALICSIACSQDADPAQLPETSNDHTNDWLVERSEDQATATKQTEYGKIQVTCGVKNLDFASQCQAEWKKTREDKDPKEGSKDKKESHAPAAEVSISWSSKK